ncbi:hypothetical protein B0T26DRAFT_746741 [Lasiosphaeria miniovina]|uniref:Nucleolar protein 12 n=1 Tax=Lasiosphaeria miniovina TaxID=1954250 RepID=A0AA40BIM2_9PEZI|nr:uncharacterized protein B0T26DRAFT_746741 [Lasiosphaeria miniovina]KAK0734894.1 hypothetical protein B0T26DRAFT_746741 [Lasiosphaeria miniovina]
MAKGKSGFTAPSKAVDPALAALFTESAGPVAALPKSRYSELLPVKVRAPPVASNQPEEVDDEELSELSDDELDGDDSDDEDEFSNNESSESESEPEEADEEISVAEEEEEEVEAAKVVEAPVERKVTKREDGQKRKRKQRDAYDDLESSYFQKLADEEVEEPAGKRLRADESAATEGSDEDVSPDTAEDGELSADEAPVHESLSVNAAASEIEKANRTVFLSNVSTKAITSRTAKKTLMNHLASVLDKKAVPPQKIESIRFRSTAFSAGGLPKRASYITKSVMEATTKSTNAYVVYSLTQGSRAAVSQLNGTIVLDRHLRVDSVAHPAHVAHRRCIFVGNLGFVDDESVLNAKLDESGNEVTEKRKRTKVPMDVEEGLWQVFSKEAGRVESVRVVRDAATRVGKGFAYVQFYDANAVEKAIILNGKKFPPMLPRELRVSRCKAPHKTARAMEAKYGPGKPGISSDGKGKGKFNNNGKRSTSYAPKPTAEAQSLAGRAGKLLGRAGAALMGAAGSKESRPRAEPRAKRPLPQQQQSGDGAKPMKSPEDIVFEGRRASERDGRPRDLKFKQTSNKSRGAKMHKKAAAKPNRGALRAAKWKKAGGVAK